MKVLLYGSTQIQHVKDLFNLNEIEVIIEKDIHKFKYFKPIHFIKLIKKVDVVYKIYGNSTFDWRLFLSKLFRKKTITHWIGTDVLEEMQNKNNLTARINRHLTDTNLAGSSLLKKELKEVGIEAFEIPIVPIKMITNLSFMPIKHSVLVYAPEGREYFYGMNYVEFLAKKYPDVVFHIVANSKNSLFMPNVIYHGKLSLEKMNELYNKVSILFRYPEHDGLSMMLLEALAKGKHVIYPYSFPNVHTPKSRKIEDVEACFKKIINDSPKINYKGSQYVHDTYNGSQILKLYKKVL
jgi:hypothetical protein